MRVLPKYKHSFFTRLILSYTILAVVLIGLAGGYLYTQANRMMVDEIARDSQNRLSTVKNYVEQTLLKKYEDNLQNKALSTIFIQNSSYMNYLLDNGWEGNLSRIAAFRQDLDMFKQAIDGAYKLTVYFQTGNYVIDSDAFYTMPENSTDAAFIGQLNQTVLNRWITRTLSDPNNSIIDGKQVMTYVVQLPYGSSGVLTKGYLFVDVDLDYVKQAAAKIVSSPNERLYIFDKNGELIIQSADTNPDEILLVQKAIGAGETLREIADSKNGAIVLSHLEGSKSANGFTYAMIRPMNSFVLASNQFKTKIFVGCSLVLLIGFVISYMISKRFYIPMKRLVQHIRSFHQPTPAQTRMNEYAIIDNALNMMGQKIVTLESLAKTNEMKNLVLGASLGLEQIDGLPQDCRFLVVYISLVQGQSKEFKLRYEQIDHPISYEIVCLNAKEAAIICFFDPYVEVDDEAIAEDLIRVKEVIYEDIRIGAAIGTLVQSLEEIPISYQLAQQAYRYRFLYGQEAIVQHSKISSFDSTPYLFSFDLYKNALKAGDVNGANQFIDDFAHILAERNMQLEAVELALLQVVSTLYQVVIELDLQQFVPPSNLMDELKKDTLSATMDSIRSLSGQIVFHVRESGNHAHAEVILKLKTYIDEHLDEDLSLNILSEVASLAPAYISTLFGEVMRESFTEYVTRARLDKAANLLREDTSLSVAEIATLVGYRNPQYFHNKFKARFGITPVQYRQSKKTNANAI
ncbi:helix-turn-helix domain-containing protein [Paenibacillus sedimenti]|uniref:Helix-turn-helix domain-containing protein n=1 Tax=Paenibacillus sedimenti TaxID=2770274 RepID=A0A926KVZ5_9BACL|nr:helix-turn-helix domain-containing protein [Paenibacillus sedimenti]MBD0382955.1 helix-turn-helix domain-containing protein [Paenibacillus sedimenti]